MYIYITTLDCLNRLAKSRLNLAWLSFPASIFPIFRQKCFWPTSAPCASGA